MRRAFQRLVRMNGAQRQNDIPVAIAGGESFSAVMTFNAPVSGSIPLPKGKSALPWRVFIKYILNGGKELSVGFRRVNRRPHNFRRKLWHVFQVWIYPEKNELK